MNRKDTIAAVGTIVYVALMMFLLVCATLQVIRIVMETRI